MLLARKLLANSTGKAGVSFGRDCWLAPVRVSPWMLVRGLRGLGLLGDPLSLSPLHEQEARLEGKDGGCWDQTASDGCSVGGAGLQLLCAGGRKCMSSECSCCSLGSRREGWKKAFLPACFPFFMII